MITSEEFVKVCESNDVEVRHVLDYFGVLNGAIMLTYASHKKKCYGTYTKDIEYNGRKFVSLSLSKGKKINTADELKSNIEECFEKCKELKKDYLIKAIENI